MEKCKLPKAVGKFVFDAREAEGKCCDMNRDQQNLL